MLAVAALATPFTDLLHWQSSELLGLGLGCVCIAAVGLADDRKLLRGRHKLLGQCLAVGLVVGAGVTVRTVHLFGLRLELGVLSVPFTAFFLLGAINSLNLIDGMDGLLSSIAVTVSLAMAAMAAAAGYWGAAGVAVALAGALLGFLRYNFPPATIYLGDCGSMVIGLVLGTLAILCSLKAPATIALTTPLVLLTLPIFDTLAAIVRRKLTGRSIYSTDRGHLHHCLLRRGLSVPGVLLLLFGLCLLTNLGVLASHAFDTDWIALCTAAMVVGILVSARLFGYAEVLLIKERLRSLGGTFFSFGDPAKARQLEVRLQGSADWKELWDTLTAAAPALGLSRLLLDVNAPALHESYHARWHRPSEESEAPSVWNAEIPLEAGSQVVGRLEVGGTPDAEAVWMKIARVSDIVEAFGQTMAKAGRVPVRQPMPRLAEAVTS